MGVPKRFTPMPAGVGTKMYGFINTLMAGMLGYLHQLTAGQVEWILKEENASHFVFSDESAAWRDLTIPAKMIPELRKKIVSFGSCSVDEPVEDLCKLGWWEQLG
jgi:hypothetical protein